MNTEFISCFAEKIDLPPQALTLVLNTLESDEEAVNYIVNNSSLGNIKPFETQIKKDRNKGAAISLAAALAISKNTLNEYHKRGIPESVFYDTLSDITVWVNTALREENICGLLEISWLQHSLYMNMFKIGRLQYQFYKTNYLGSGFSFKQMHNAPIKNKSDVLNIHIPEGGRLDFSECERSLNEARLFFSKYYPEYKYSGFVCDSWLLDTNNKLFMSENSNIIRFADLFNDVYKTKFNNTEIIRRLWNVHSATKIEIAAFEEKTDLQKRTKNYLLSGGKTGNGYGFML